MGAPESPADAGQLAPGTVVIGDLHLDPMGGRDVEEFVRWLDGLRGVPRLVVLGDLFDLWIGPEQTRLPGSIPVLDALKRFTWRGGVLDVVAGNRDFLLDGSFEAWTGAALRVGGFTATTPAEQRVLVIHGDELCTLDLAYQRMKRVLRARWTRAVFGALPFAVKRKLAAGVRGTSRRVVPRKPESVRAMQESTCRELARQHAARTVVCGHAHTFRDERLEDGPRWLVIDGWGGRRDALRLDRGGEWVGLEARSLA